LTVILCIQSILENYAKQFENKNHSFVIFAPRPCVRLFDGTEQL